MIFFLISSVNNVFSVSLRERETLIVGSVQSRQLSQSLHKCLLLYVNTISSIQDLEP